MKYTRNQINKAGNIILTSKNSEEVNKAIDLINDWRTSHLIPLNILGSKILQILKGNKIKPIFTSQRIKRLTSIEYKLDLNPEMGLGGINDIGGFRIVLDNVKTLNDVFLLLSKQVPKEFTLEKIYNYVEIPKESGYRSIHFIYKHHSEVVDVNGLKIELQIRTKLQHNWATAVETAGLYTKTPLKSSQGEDVWLNFFKIVSSLFSIKEQLPVMKEYSQYSMLNLMAECHKLNQNENISPILSALNVTVENVGKNTYDNGYCILDIDLINRIATVNIYKQTDENIAMEEYSAKESNIDNNKNAVVLVSVSSIKELRNAYPSYFLDTTEFIQALDKISANCKRLGLIKK